MLTNYETAQADEVRSLIISSDEQRFAAGLILLAMKSECQHGAWLPFLERAGIGERRAQRLMQWVRSLLISDKLSDLGMPADLAKIIAALRQEPDARIQLDQARAVLALTDDIFAALGHKKD